MTTSGKSSTCIEESHVDANGLPSSRRRSVVLLLVIPVSFILFVLFILSCNRANTTSLEDQLRRADALYDERQYDEVVGVSTEVLKKESDNTDALLLRGRAYYKLEDLGHAQQDFARILGTDPDNPNAYDGLGVIQAKSNRLEEAIAFYDLAIALNGTDFLVFYHRGLTYHLAGNDSLAISDFEKAVELNPMHADSYLGLGIAHIDSGEYEVGAQFCSTAIDLNPDFSLAYYNRGLAHLLQDQIDEAISDYTIAIELGLSIPNVYNGRGRAYLQSRNIELAISDLEYALELDPHFIKASEALQEARQMLSELDTLDDTP